MASRGPDSTHADRGAMLLHRPVSNFSSNPSTGMINLLYQLSIVIPEDLQYVSNNLADRGDFPLATLLQIEHEFLRRPLDRLDGMTAAGLGSHVQRLVYEVLRRTGLVLVSAAVHSFQQTPGSHSNLDHNLMSLFMLDMSSILSYSPSFAIFVLCSTGPFTTEALRENVVRWLAVAADRTSLSNWPAARALLANQFFYYPSLLDMACPLLWHECELLLLHESTAMNVDT